MGSTHVTRWLCEHLAGFTFDALPGKVVHAARRGVLDWIGCALAGCRHPTLDKLNRVLSETGGKPVATIIGRNTRLGLLDAPLANGQAGHVLDYDDTHMGGTLLHTSSPTLAALFALADRDGASGKAASGGVLAALLAQQGFDSSQEILEGKKGFCRIYSTVARPELVTDGLGERWEIANNGHKPYACGVVLHPPIDAMIELGTRVSAPPESVEAVELRAHPHVISVTGVVEPRTGLQSKFSIYHSAAVAFIDRNAGIAQYTDQKALDPRVVALRRKVKVTTDDSLRTDEAYAAVTAAGKRYEASVAHASGTVDNPMSDEALERKFRSNAEPVIGGTKTSKVVELVWRLESLSDVRELTALLA